MATTMITKEEEEEKKMVTLVSSDKKKFVVEQKVAEQSFLIKSVIEGCGIESPIPVYLVTGDLLSSILDYCEKHAAEEKEEEEEMIKEWDREYMEKTKKDLELFHDLMMAANYLHVQGLLDLLAQTFANMITMKTPEQIRQMFNIKNDFTPEEEERINREWGWAFEQI